MRLLVIGVDAMSPDLVRSLRPRLPHIDQLTSAGGLFDVEVRGDPCTPEIWTSFATGLAREKHPVRHLTVHESGELWRADAVPQSYLPDKVLNSQGIATGLFNIPVITYPCRPTAGWMASGDMLYPQSVYPPQFGELLEPYPPPACDYYYAEDVTVTEDMVREKHDHIYREFTERGQVSLRNLKRLLDWLAPDVVIAYWHFLDSIQHHLLCDSQRIAEAYVLVDDFVGDLVSRYEPDHVLLVSDHGMRLVTETDGGERLVTIGDWDLMEMRWEGRRYVTSGVHSGTALCAASWPVADEDGQPQAIEEILPWALGSAGIDWAPCGDTPSVGVPGDASEMTPDERRAVLQRLRDLGYE